MDRGRTCQWPRWSVVRELVEVPLHEAVQYDDPENMPVISLNRQPGALAKHNSRGEYGIDPEEIMTAYMERPQLDDVERVGWAEVMWQICKACPFVDPHTLGMIFRVPMDWYQNMNVSPLSWTTREAALRGWSPG